MHAGPASTVLPASDGPASSHSDGESAPGRHTVSVTYMYTANIPGACANQATDTPACSPKAGTGQTFSKTLIVS